jgi:alkanesulfonate monooxygenase SsuD/methylene tetrahydromethanopterin reductase-like flavin-dependent oxidoreductase (luciferase family)
VGRDPGGIDRSAAILVVLDRDSEDRPLEEGVVPVEGSAERIAGRLREFGEAGADEVILILSPITETSIRSLGEVLEALDT